MPIRTSSARRTFPIRVKRVYAPVEPGDGWRVLVDRLWPRGISREEARLAAWVRDVAPSDALRRWYGHRPERFDRFRERYREELERSSAAWSSVAAEARRRPVTLVCGAKDPARSNATVLKEWLEEHRSP